MLENQRRPTFVLGKLLNPKDPGMYDPVQELELSHRCIPPLRPGGFRRLKRYGIHSDTPLGLWETDVRRLPVLVDIGLQHETFEHVIAHFAVPLRRSNTGLLHGAADRLGHRPINPASGRTGPIALRGLLPG
jgi:hypothetical protein